MKDFKRIIIGVLVSLLILVLFLIFYAVYYKSNIFLSLSDISIVKVNDDKTSFNISIKGNSKEEFICTAYNDTYNTSSPSTNGVCNLTLKINKDYKIYLNNNHRKTKEVNLTDYVDNILSFNFEDDIIYMVLGDKKSLKYDELVIDNNKKLSKIKSSNEDIVSINNGVMKANVTGQCEIKTESKSIKIVVTDIIEKPTYHKEKKEIIPCNRYSKSEAELLDKLLSFKINESGYKTRAGALEAARFLTLEFKYRIPYFYENGRVHPSGVHFADGEGRYYKVGLYLDDSKKDDIIASYRGPAIWGCPLTNLEPAPEYGYIMGSKKPNGLDCSGFISWALKNAGFDPGDIGAGDSDYPYQMTKLGEFVRLTPELIKSGKIRAGDLINYWGHIGMIIGIDEDSIYVAESLPNLGGAVAKKYLKTNIGNTFTHVVLMDEYYKNDGNLTSMWS